MQPQDDMPLAGPEADAWDPPLVHAARRADQASPLPVDAPATRIAPAIEAAQIAMQAA